MDEFRCDGSHEHQRIEGKCRDGESRSHKCRIWPWRFATVVAASCAALVRKHRTRLAFPTVEQQTGDCPEPEHRSRSNRFHWPCHACRTNMPADHRKHTRHHSDCRWPFVEPVDWECPACKDGKKRSNVNHNNLPGQCRWFEIPTRRGAPRQGHHPRDPRKPATDDPAAPATLDELERAEAAATPPPTAAVGPPPYQLAPTRCLLFRLTPLQAYTNP